MLSSLPRHQGRAVSCVTARAGETGFSDLAIADIVADHRPAPAAACAADMFASLPGCSVFLARDARGGYVAFMRDRTCYSIRCARGHGDVPAADAEACAAVLYAWACAAEAPPALMVVITLPDHCGRVI